MNTVTCGVRSCEVYLEDTVAYSSTLFSASLTLNPAKREFGKAVVTYLGKDKGKVCPVTAKLLAIMDFPILVRPLKHSSATPLFSLLQTLSVHSSWILMPVLLQEEVQGIDLPI